MKQIDIILILLFFLLNILLIINFKKLSQFFNIYDIPDQIRKKHSHKVSLLGGTIILLPILFSFIIVFINNDSFSNLKKIFFENEKSYLLFFSSCILMYLIGLFDDKFNLNYLLKLFFTTTIIVFLLYLDENVLITKIHLSFYQKQIDISKINLFFTCLCFLLFINALNMFDGIDGQVGFYSIFFVFFIFFLIGYNLLILLLLISFFSFLYLNLKMKCFLGDSGSILLGFIFSYLIIRLYNQNVIYFADNIFLLMLIPGLDMFRLFAERLIFKKNPFKGDNSHIHHLFQKKYSKYKTIFLIQFLVLTPVFLSFYFSLFIVNFLSILVYFTVISILKSSKN